jgi:5-methylcytosine-specific restriction protein A
MLTSLSKFIGDVYRDLSNLCRRASLTSAAESRYCAATEGEGTALKVIDDQGHELDAHFTLERLARGIDLIVASRGGAGKATPAGRNIDYEKGVEILLARLAQRRAVLDGVSVDSAVARRLPPEVRRLAAQGFQFPLELSAVTQIRALRLDIRRSVVAFGQPEGAIGGNPTKRLRLHLDWPAAASLPLEVLEADLARSESVPAAGGFDPVVVAVQVAAAINELRVRTAQNLPISQPVGGPGGVKARGETFYYPRKGDVIAWVLHAAGGHCEICSDAGPFLKSDGEPYLEVHHVRHLADGGPDQIDNAVAACPNCHRRLHFAADREALRLALVARIPRLVDYPKVDVIDLLAVALEAHRVAHSPYPP